MRNSSELRMGRIYCRPGRLCTDREHGKTGQCPGQEERILAHQERVAREMAAMGLDPAGRRKSLHTICGQVVSLFEREDDQWCWRVQVNGAGTHGPFRSRDDALAHAERRLQERSAG